MRKGLMFVVTILVAAVFLSSCAIGPSGPRGSAWDSPPKIFTTNQVFKAALQAGGQNGMSTTSSDRESGTISFSRVFPGGGTISARTMYMRVLIMDLNGIVRVTTNAASDKVSTGGPIPISMGGLMDEAINNFHVYLFQNLNITNPAERKVRIGAYNQ